MNVNLNSSKKMEFEVYFRVRKGNGPAWVDKHVKVYFDDLPTDLTAEQVRQMAKEEAKKELIARGYTDRTMHYVDTYNA